MENPFDNNTLPDGGSKEEIVGWLRARGEERAWLFAQAARIKREHVGNSVYLRGLVEYSNRCAKNCYYCGIRRSNPRVRRYTMTDAEVIEAARYACRAGYASLVIQGGELSSTRRAREITRLLEKIGAATGNSLGITLSLGEQPRETLRAWKEAGARRYLLRVETSNPALYAKIHPNDARHDFQKRLDTLRHLRELGYQVGTGCMIGLPFQTLDDLAGDLLFFKEIDADMVGMGPYVEHEETPLYRHRELLLPPATRLDLALKMIAILRVLMPDINIVATTAMQALDKIGREKALKAGANIIMPNITPVKYRADYLLYENKPCIDEEAEQCKECLDMRVRLAGDEIRYGEWGDSRHFARRTVEKTGDEHAGNDQKHLILHALNT
ncbi:MAG: [FeFe] hydrogenase H-cluster radical SAM maturase HydE [Odoribacteraceae bacterium]|jgi:biotin synthase|nr:[FeFe] hydrogenase H-cluster radical SAM maturase HydE [Odoribacteraceae bacterium]